MLSVVPERVLGETFSFSAPPSSFLWESLCGRALALGSLAGRSFGGVPGATVGVSTSIA